MDIIKVKTKKELLRFIKSQKFFYKDDPNFVMPVIMDRLKLFNPKKNPFFEHAQIQNFLAIENSKVVGRISAIYNGNHLKTHNDGVGFFGFFESINDKKVSSALFQAAENWLKEKGITKIRGPVNPSQNDELGFLLEGFDSPPLVLMTYSPKYYLDLAEDYGFKKAKDLYAYTLDKNFASDKLVRYFDKLKDRFSLNIRNVNFKNKEQFVKDVKTLKEIYNGAWEKNWGFVKMTDAEFDFLAADLKSFADENLVLIVEKDSKPVGFVLALPDIYQPLIHNKSGGIIGAAWHLLTKKSKITNMRIIVLGVLPEFRKVGAEALLYYEIGQRGIKRGITMAEASWILEDNELMNRGLTQSMNGRLYKKYRLYEKEI